MPKITLVRGDGTRLEADTPEQADRLALLGYKKETPVESLQASKTAATTDYYEDQKLQTAAEGFGAGLTFGATDYLFGNDETKKRAAYNPGTRIGTEILGALVPLVLSGGESSAVSGARAVEEAGVLAKTAKAMPPSLLSDAARALAPGVEGSLTKAVSRGLIEGGAYGGAAAADHAYLDGEPITAEAVLHGIGWGAVVGGGLSALGHGVEVAGKRAAASVAAEQEAARVASLPPVARGALSKTSGAEYSALRNEVEAISGHLHEAGAAADASVKDTVSKLLAKGETADLAAFNNSEVEFVKTVREVESLYKKVFKAADANKFDKAAGAMAEYNTLVNNIAKNLGTEMPNPSGALDELLAMKMVGTELKHLPKSVEGFAQLSPGKIERTLAALDKVKKLDMPNTQALTDSAQSFSRSLGIEADDLRSTWRAAKDLYKKEGKAAKALPEPERKEPSFLRKAAGYVVGAKAYVAASSTGMGRVGSYAAYRGAKSWVTGTGGGLAATRANTIGRLKTAASQYMPSVGKKAARSAPKFSLATTLFGGQDGEGGDPRDMAARRIKEINDFAPTASNTIFRAVEPLSVTQPSLAPAMHKSAVESFKALWELTPKDPGVISMLQSIWKPSDVQALELAKNLEVFHDPIGAMESMLESNSLDPTKVTALKKFAPSVWTLLRVEMLDRITRPEVIEKITYPDQVALSLLLDVSLHTSMDPGYIATSQQMFLDRNQPLQANPTMGQGGGMPDPSDNVNSTQAQKSAAR